MMYTLQALEVVDIYCLGLAEAPHDQAALPSSSFGDVMEVVGHGGRTSTRWQRAGLLPSRDPAVSVYRTYGHQAGVPPPRFSPG